MHGHRKIESGRRMEHSSVLRLHATASRHAHTHPAPATAACRQERCVGSPYNRSRVAWLCHAACLTAVSSGQEMVAIVHTCSMATGWRLGVM